MRIEEYERKTGKELLYIFLESYLKHWRYCMDESASKVIRRRLSCLILTGVHSFYYLLPLFHMFFKK